MTIFLIIVIFLLLGSLPAGWYCEIKLDGFLDHLFWVLLWPLVAVLVFGGDIRAWWLIKK